MVTQQEYVDLFFFRKSEPASLKIARSLYDQIVAAARREVFYNALEVPDTIDGRFDILCIHAFIVMRRLKQLATAESSKISQALFDVMFKDMEGILRQIGISDLKIGKEVKKMAKAFLGRVDAYDTSLDTEETDIAEAIHRNVYRGNGKTIAIRALADYMQTASIQLATQPESQILAGKVTFPDAAIDGL